MTGISLVSKIVGIAGVIVLFTSGTTAEDIFNVVHGVTEQAMSMAKGVEFVPG